MNTPRLRTVLVALSLLWTAQAYGQDEPPPPPAEVVTLTPPRLLHSEPPIYPESHIDEQVHPNVVVQVVLDEHGHVVDTTIEHSAGEDFDREAAAAVRRWRFEPARRGERAIPSRIRVAVHFVLPAFDLEGAAPIDDLPTIPHAGSEEVEHAVGGHAGGPERTDPAGAPEERPADPEPEAEPEQELEPEPEREPEPESGELAVEVTVERPEGRAEDRTAGDFRVQREVLELTPLRDGADVLNRAPGVYVARMGGGAVAPRIFLRGFDAEHGQDLELRVGGLRANQASHIHGQGYADLGFLIPETVDELRVHEGVYDPQQGDFAIAGTIDIRLGVRQRGVHLLASYGSFNSVRALGLWAPRGEARETFGAVQYQQTDGFGQNRAGQRGVAVGQGVFSIGAGWRVRALAIAHAARYQTAGLVSEDDVDAGRLGFYDAYGFATARAQVASTERLMLSVGAEHAGERGESGELTFFGGYDSFRFLPNFTGFLEAPSRGDLIAQTNRTTSLGLRGRYRTSDKHPLEWLRAALELGLSGRMDLIGQQQSSVDAEQMNRAFAQHIDADVSASDVGMYVDADLGLTSYADLRVGVRGDLLAFEINDRVVEGESPVPGLLPGLERSALGFALSPRASLEVRPVEHFSLRAAYGEGFRSPQARTLAEGDAPYTKVRSADLGARLSFDEVLSVTAAGFLAHVDSDVAFEPHEGTLEAIGPSRRLGFVVNAQTHPLPWLLGAVSLTYVNAELVDAGQPVPYVPPLVLRADVGVRHEFPERVVGQHLRLRVGVGFTYLAPRPQRVGPDAPDVALLDASAALGLGPVEVGVDLQNLTDARYATVAQTFESNWRRGDAPSGRETRHFAAGAPLTVLATVRVHL